MSPSGTRLFSQDHVGRTGTARAVAMPLVAAAVACDCTPVPPAPARDDLVQQITATETAFAHTIVARDHAAFLSFVADDAVFPNGGDPLRGKAAIGARWKTFHTDAEAPFTWRPERVDVLASGMLAQTAGPVSADGKVVAHFHSTWRREPDGGWRIVFDDADDACAGEGR